MAHATLHGATFPDYELKISVLAKNWWMIALRGLVAVLFGLTALFLPGATMLSLLLAFAAYALVDGVLAIVSAVRAAGAHQRWGYLVFDGLVSIAAAIVVVLWPELGVLAFVGIIAAWAILTGVFEVAAAIRLDFIDGRGWLAFGGILSILFGCLLIGAPLAGAVVLTWWLGAYAILFGVTLIVLGFKLRGHTSAQ